MTRSHPPTLRRHVERCLKRECELPGGAGEVSLVVAVSGGSDSLALLDCLVGLASRFRLALHVVSIDHGLRPEAALETRRVESYCQERGVRFEGVRVTVQGPGGPQAAARQARYAALFQVADRLGPETLIATAHQRDDRAETVLLRLLRGVSLEGLAVLPAREGRLIRPMIRASRQDVLAHCVRHDLWPSEDPSNLDPSYQRTRVRREVLPLLENLAPGIRATLNALADEACLLDRPLGLSREQRRQLRQALLDPGVPLDLPLGSGLRVRRERP